jgi:toxin ParE1/3/4
VYHLTRKAAEDVRHIYRDGKRLFGRLQADEYHSHLQKIFEMLGDKPTLARLRGEITPPVRVHPTGAHLVIYVQQESGGILIVRVRHYRENWQS